MGTRARWLSGATLLLALVVAGRAKADPPGELAPRAGAAGRRARAARAVEGQAQALATRARGHLAAARRAVGEARTALRTAADQLGSGIDAGGRPPPPAAAAEEAEREAAGYARLLAICTERAAGRPAEALRRLSEETASLAPPAQPAGLYLLALLRLEAGDPKGALGALADPRVGAAFPRAPEVRLWARAPRLPTAVGREVRAVTRALERRRLAADRRAAAVRRTREAALARVEANAERRLAEARARLARASEALGALEAIPEELPGLAEEIGALRAAGDAAEAEAALLARLAAATQASAARRWQEAAQVAEELIGRERPPGDVALEARAIAANAHLALGRPAEALRVLGEPAEDWPARLHRARGLALAATGDRGAAVASLDRADLDDRDVDGLVLRARLLVEGGDAARAQPAVDRALAVSPVDPFLLRAAADLRLAAGRGAEALPLVERLVALDPADRTAAYRLARLLLAAGRLPDAARALDRTVGPAGAPAPVVREAALGRGGHDLLLVPVYPVAASLPPEPDEGRARLLLGAWLLERGRTEDAAAELRLAAGEGVAWARGLAALRLGRLEEAERALRAAEPGRPEGPHGLGLVALARGEPDAAAGHFREAIARAPGDPAPELGLAVADARAGRRAEAEARLARLVGHRRHGATARLDLGVLALEAGRPDDAARALAALGKDALPGRPERAMLAGHVARARGDGTAARAAYEDAVALAPDYLDAWTALGEAALAARDWDRAAAALRQVADLSPGSAEARELLARAYAGAGNAEAAARERERAGALRAEARERLRETARAGAIGVAAFDNVARSEAHDWMSQGIPEALATDLRRTGLTVVERTQLVKAVEEQRLGRFGLVDPATAPRAGKLVGARAMVVGSFEVQGDSARLRAQIVDVEGGDVLCSADGAGPLAGLAAVERRLAVALVSGCYGLAEADQRKLLASPLPSMRALEDLAAARLLLANGSADAARERFRKALAEDPAFAREAARFDAEWAGETATVACLPFDNLSGDAEHEWYARGLAESLTGDLSRLGVLTVERLAIERLMAERRFARFTDAAEARAAGSLLGASMIVVGSYQVHGGRLQIDARLVDVETGQVMLAERVAGSTGGLFELEAQLTEKIAGRLSRPVTSEQAARLRQGKPTLEDYKRFVRARSQVAVSEAGRGKVKVAVVAVAAFEPAGPADAAIAARLAGGVRRALAETRRLEVVGERAVAAAAGDGVDPKALGAAVGADAVVVGSVQVVDGRLRAEARVISSSSGEVLAAAEAQGRVAELARVEGELATSLKLALDLGQPAGRRAARPLHRRWWFWGGVGATVAAGVVTTLLVTQAGGEMPSADVSLDCTGGSCERR